jgi:hypothetical protein
MEWRECFAQVAILTIFFLIIEALVGDRQLHFFFAKVAQWVLFACKVTMRPLVFLRSGCKNLKLK